MCRVPSPKYKSCRGIFLNVLNYGVFFCQNFYNVYSNMNFKQLFFGLLIVYILMVIKYYSKFPNDTVLYIEDEPTKNILNNSKLTIYDIPPKINTKNWNTLNETKIHRYFYPRQFYCNVSKESQLQIFVFSPNETINLYPKTNIFKLYQYSDIDIFKPNIEKYPNFANSESIEFQLIGQQVFTLPRGWWLYIENPSYVLTKILI